MTKKTRDVIQLHWLRAYPASCIVRGEDGRPKMLTYGGVERARISSAGQKRATRTSDLVAERLTGKLGDRTRRIEDVVMARLVADGLDPAKIKPALDVTLAAYLPLLGKVDDKDVGRLKQLVFLSPEEFDRLADLTRQEMAGTKKKPKGDKVDIGEIIGKAVGAIDVAANGRMFADAPEYNMTAALDLAHLFTVGRAHVETDFYVAVDDHARGAGEVAGGFMGDSFFTTGLFYGYARIDMNQFAANLDDPDLAAEAAAAYIEALVTVTPSGKRSNFASHGVASWVMAERGSAADTSLAAAYLRPVSGEDQLSEAIQRATSMANAVDRAYGRNLDRRVMDLSKDDTLSIADVAAIAKPVAKVD